MMQARERGKEIVGEYCQEHAEYHKEDLTSSGLLYKYLQSKSDGVRVKSLISCILDIS